MFAETSLSPWYWYFNSHKKSPGAHEMPWNAMKCHELQVHLPYLLHFLDSFCLAGMRDLILSPSQLAVRGSVKTLESFPYHVKWQGELGGTAIFLFIVLKPLVTWESPRKKLHTGGFLSHGTPSYLPVMDFPWNKPSSYWGTPIYGKLSHCQSYHHSWLLSRISYRKAVSVSLSCRPIEL